MGTVEGHLLGPGGKLFGTDSDAISGIDVTLLPPSTVAYNEELDAEFELTISDAALVTDEVLAVANYDGLRWILITPTLPEQAAHTVLANLTGSSAEPEADTTTALLIDVNTQNTSSSSTVTNTGTTITVSGLDGDNDGGYEIEFDLALSLSGNTIIQLRPNGLTTNQTSLTTATTVGNVSALQTATLELGTLVSSTTRVKGIIRAQSSGATKVFFGDVWTDRTQHNDFSGEWSAATNITSFSIVSNVNSTIASGTLKIRKLHLA